MVLFDAPAQGGKRVYRIQGSQIYHENLECSRLRQNPDRRGHKTKRPNPFPEGEAKLLGWTSCRFCRDTEASTPEPEAAAADAASDSEE